MSFFPDKLRNFVGLPGFFHRFPRVWESSSRQIVMKKLSVSMVTAAVLTPVLVLAQTPECAPDVKPDQADRRGGGKRDQVRPFVEGWKAADTNQDGFISKEEFEALPRIQKLPEEKRVNLFNRLDKDKDGQLSREEIGRIGKPQGPNPNPPMQRLWELDTDHSGGISLEEFKAGRIHAKLPPEKQEALFRRLDTDKDGVITPKDKPEPPFRRDGDKNKPRRQGRPDGDRPPGQAMEPRMIIRQLDKDGDAALSFDEFRAGPAAKDLTEDEQKARFEALDRNHDNQITREDFPPPAPRDGEGPRGPRGPRNGEGPQGPPQDGGGLPDRPRPEAPPSEAK